MRGRTLVQFWIVTLIWGSTWLIIKSQLETVPSTWSVAYRFIAAGALMLGFCAATGKPMRLSPQGHLFALAMAVAQFVGNFNLVYLAETHVTSGLVAVAFALLVVPNSLFAWAFLGQRLTLRFALGSLMGMAGVAMLFQHELAIAEFSGGVLTGLGLTLCAILCASTANVLQATDLARAQPPFASLGIAFLYGGLLDAALGFATAGPPVIDTSLTYLGGLAFLAIIASAVAFLLYFDVIRAIGPAKAAYSSLVTPFIALGLSTMFEGYRWTPLAVAGVALAVGGMWVALASPTPSVRKP